MRVVFLLLVFLYFPFSIGRGEQSKLQDEYLTTCLLLNYSERIEKEGYVGLAYTIYRDCQERLARLHARADLEAKEYELKMTDLKAKLAGLKNKLADGDTPPPIDSVYQEFLRLALADDQSTQVNVNENLSKWEEFQNNHPNWQPRLVSNFIRDDHRALDRAKAH